MTDPDVVVPKAPSRAETVIGVGALAIGLVATLVVFRNLRHDDAFICFQYARNLGSGRGLVFNPGERVFGFTSPLDVLVLAAVYSIFGDVLPTAATVLGSLSLAAQALFLYLLLRPRSIPLAAAVSSLTFAGLAGAHSWLALETNLFAALVLATVWALERRWPIRAGLLLGLTFLCRYDGALLVPVAVALLVRVGRREVLSVLVVALAVVAPWLVFSTVYFGSCLPHTLFAKHDLTPFGAYLSHYLSLFAADPWRLVPSAQLSAWLTRVTPLLWVTGLVYVWLYSRRLLGWVVFCVGLLLAYALIGARSVQHWHMYTVELASLVLVLLGTLGWIERVRRFRVAGLAWGGVGLGLLAAVAAYADAPSLRESFWLGQRDHYYRDISSWYLEHLRPGQSFLSAEVGTLGYLTGARMIDPYGLINETNDYPATTSLQSFMGVAQFFQPQVLLVNSLETGLQIEAHTGYRVVKVFAWQKPWSTLLIKEASALAAPGELEELHAAAMSGLSP